jgi:hypothetical protein
MSIIREGILVIIPRWKRSFLVTSVFFVVLLLDVLATSLLGAAEEDYAVERPISISWKGGRPEGQILISDGSLVKLEFVQGKGTLQAKDRFSCAQDGPCRLYLQLKGSELASGKGSTIVTVQTKTDPFSFFLRDVDKRYPIYIPAYGVMVSEADDDRSYDQVEEAIRSRGLQSQLQHIESEPEESFEAAAQNTRYVRAETWLGVSRDWRVFAFDPTASDNPYWKRYDEPRFETIEPRFHGARFSLKETDDKPVRYRFFMGRGWGPVDKITRRLEDGVLPILRGTLVDGAISYNVTAFATLEKSKLTPQTLRGTHFLVAGAGNMLTAEQKAQFDSLLPGEKNREEETVLLMRVEALNTASVPQYCWFRNPAPYTPPYFYPPGGRGTPRNWSFDGKSGFGRFGNGKVYAVAQLNGKPMPSLEVALLLKPGETATIDIYIPHQPISSDRAVELAKVNFSDRHQECRSFWRQKLDFGAQISLPEKRVDEMIRAGLLHLDLILYGLEPDGTLAPTIGVYPPIGTESAPIITFLDSMGWHDVARRSLMYFLDKQHDDGFIQNFGGYMVETGAALWTMAEHYRYTRDEQWVRQIAPKLLKSCEYILRWRERNKREELRGRGYGMLEGKVGDPDDPYRFFMLNGYHYLGLKGVAEMLARIDPPQSKRLAEEAEALKRDIRVAFFEGVGRAPVVPLADGSWCPTAPLWVEDRGPLALYAEGGNAYTHGSTVIRDSTLGSIWLIPQQVLDANEPVVALLLAYHNELLTRQGAAFGQPYYSQHPFVHLIRDEVKPFLKAYYNTVAPMADRETYTFWEEYLGGCQHKTHEEAQFLMQTRRMLYLEKGDTLQLLSGVPRRYLENGKRIKLDKVASYFGQVSLTVESKLEQGRNEAVVECLSDRRPRRVEVRLPHPQGRKATRVKGGKYDPQTERVYIEPFNGRAEITLGFGLPTNDSQIPK